MKYVGIDFGSKKVGFAQSDEEGKIAFPLMISPNDAQLLKDTVELIREVKVATVVIGESVDQKGKPNAIAKEARGFAAKLEKACDVKIVFEKEWFSTTEARKQPGKEGDHNVDDSSAAIVLQRYLDKENGPGIAAEEEYSEEEEETEAVDNW
jgi:putative Holliday junction resolvase